LEGFARDCEQQQDSLLCAALQGLCALQYRTSGAVCERRLASQGARKRLEKEVTVAFFTSIMGHVRVRGEELEEKMLSSLPSPWLESALDLGVWDDDEDAASAHCMADLHLKPCDMRALVLARHARGASGVLAPLSVLPEAAADGALRGLWGILLSPLRAGGGAATPQVFFEAWSLLHSFAGLGAGAASAEPESEGAEAASPLAGLVLKATQLRRALLQQLVSDVWCSRLLSAERKDTTGGDDELS
jgi:hypothetical protein